MCLSRKGYVITDGVYIQGVSLMVKLLFLEVSSSRATVILFQYFFANSLDPSFMKDLSHYIEYSKPFPLYTYSSSNHALKYMSYQASSLVLYER